MVVNSPGVVETVDYELRRKKKNAYCAVACEKASQRTNKQTISECIVGLNTSAKMDVPGDFAKTTPIAFFDSYPTLKRQPLHIPVDFQASLRHTPCFRR